MAYLIGIGLALAILLLVRLVGLDRDRGFYPTVMIVIALLYGLFAVMGGSMRALGLESVAMTGFIFVAILGFKRNLWWVVGALFAHGVYDFFHGHLFINPGVPAWWPQFCSAFDVVAAAFLAGLIWLAKTPAKPR
jgi:hypothetical protein